MCRDCRLNIYMSVLPPRFELHILGEMAASRLLIFGDQSNDPLPSIWNLQQQAQHSPVLRCFLEATDRNLRYQRTQLREKECGLVGRFESVASLAEGYSQQKDAVGSGILHCIAQLGSLILYELNFTARKTMLNS